MNNQRIGVYICHCGGNISDYVDVDRVCAAVRAEPGVAVAKTAMFACSDATQQEMAQDIQEQNLDGLVVASCSPKLHLFTFREVAKRAGLNLYQYTQVNIREQCSWTHTDDREGGTEKAIRLIRAGVARTGLTTPLEPIVIQTVPRVLVVGAGVAGLQAAVGLADLGLAVVLAEKSPEVGGRVAGLGKMYPHGKTGREIVDHLVEEVKKRELITLFTGTELVEKSGSVGDFQVKLKVGGRSNGCAEEVISMPVGSIIVASGFEPYQPGEGEYSYGSTPGVVTLSEFRALLDNPNGDLVYNGKEVKDIAYIYCVGSRQPPEEENAKHYCSRYCCNTAVHTALLAFEKNPQIHQFHLCRDIRTYGKFELLYHQAMMSGSIFLKFSEEEPPVVEEAENGKLRVTVKDLLTWGERIALEVDLVVLVTGMVPRENRQLIDVLKLPLGRDGFFNEIHPKLRPVETVVTGVFICGTGAGPKNSSESIASALAAVTQSASLLKKGYVELEPLIAAVNPELCAWCGVCAGACPYGAIDRTQAQGKEVAQVNSAVCKGCGGCVPTCPAGALNLEGYTDAQIKSMIDAFLIDAFLKEETLTLAGTGSLIFGKPSSE